MQRLKQLNMTSRGLWRLNVWLVATAVGLISCAGCDRPALKTLDNLVQVTGRVTLDNQPLARTSVVFLPVESGSRARGMTNNNGEFQLLDESETAGIFPGEYRVVFNPLSIPVGNSTQPLGKEYQSPESTPVRATISKATKSLNIELRSVR